DHRAERRLAAIAAAVQLEADPDRRRAGRQPVERDADIAAAGTRRRVTARMEVRPLGGLRARHDHGTDQQRRQQPLPHTRSLSHSPTAPPSVPMSLASEWLPLIFTTVRSGPAGGIPNGSDSPWTIRTGTETASSSGSRVFSGRPGGCSGNARQSTPTAPVSAAVRHATRAPLERPPTSRRS